MLDVLGRGGTVAVVTDAGTPGISDPGEWLTRAAIEAGFEVSSIPGPAAFVSALVTSGLPTTRFVFEGFLPRTGTDRRERLADIATERRTVVLYEAPHRIVRTLADLREVCGDDRPVAVARELTKLYETIERGTLGTIDVGSPARRVRRRARRARRRPRSWPTRPPSSAALDESFAGGLSTKDAAAAVASRLGIPRREAYAAAVERRTCGAVRWDFG